MPLRIVKSAGTVVSTPTRFTLAPGEVWIPPLGDWVVRTSYNGSFQYLDPTAQIWTSPGGNWGSFGGARYHYSDGLTFRIANQTGCVVGAVMTNAGTGYTSSPTVTASAGGSIWRAVVGGAVSTTVTVTAAGLNYAYPPAALFSAPPTGGVQATGYVTLSSNTVSTVTVTNQGAGYITPPTITFQNDPREGLNGVTYGYGAVAATSLTGSQTITALLCIDHGTGAQTTLPTLAFSGGGGASAAATAIMCWNMTGYTVSSGGTGWTTAPLISAYDNFPTGGVGTNPAITSSLVAGSQASIIGAVTAGAITATGLKVVNPGIYTGTPTIVMQTSGILITASAALLPVMGGGNAEIFAQQL